jgi:hypothetical protein
MWLSIGVSQTSRLKLRYLGIQRKGIEYEAKDPAEHFSVLLQPEFYPGSLDQMPSEWDVFSSG